MAKDSVTLALKSGSTQIPALTIFALEHCNDEIGKMGEPGLNLVQSTRIMCNVFAAACLDQHPEITSDSLIKRSSMTDYEEINRAFVELLNISGMVPEKGDEDLGETQAAA